MLPDYPEIKKKLLKVFINRLKTISNGSPFNEVGKHTIFEGDRQKLIRSDGRLFGKRVYP